MLKLLNKKTIYISALIIALIAAAVSIFVGVHYYKLTKKLKDSQASVATPTTSVIVPRDLDSDRLKFTDLYPLNGILTQTIDDQIQAGFIQSSSIYYRDLNSGHWLGINEDEHFIPASLYKLPLAFAVYRLAEMDPSILKKQITYNGQYLNSTQDLDKPPLLVMGQSYTVKDLIDRSLIYSDNVATSMVFDAIGSTNYVQVFKDLGINFSTTDATKNTITTQIYSLFLRALYSDVYLNKSDSKYLLDVMTTAQYKNGLVAGVPSDVKVAHKFGERTVTSPQVTHQLHDCGIVLYPSHPYILCIMSKGGDFSALEAFSKKISETAYNFVHKSE